MKLPDLPLAQEQFSRYYTNEQIKAYGEACYRKAIEDALMELDVRARIAGTRGTKASNLIRTVLTEVIVTLRDFLK